MYATRYFSALRVGALVLSTLLFAGYVHAQGEPIDEVYQKALLINPHDVLQPAFQDIGDHPSPSGFGDSPGGELIGRGIHMIYPDARKALFKYRENPLRIDLGEGAITVENPLFL